jgi:hypothetical protein
MESAQMWWIIGLLVVRDLRNEETYDFPEQGRPVRPMVYVVCGI